jgi:hypothetical protein
MSMMLENLEGILSVLAIAVMIAVPFYMASRPRKTKIFDDGTNNLTNDRVSHH